MKLAFIMISVFLFAPGRVERQEAGGSDRSLSRKLCVLCVVLSWSRTSSVLCPCVPSSLSLRRVPIFSSRYAQPLVKIIVSRHLIY